MSIKETANVNFFYFFSQNYIKFKSVTTLIDVNLRLLMC